MSTFGNTFRSITSSLAAGALVIAVAVPLAAQSTDVDPRWQPWLGCWRSPAAPQARTVGEAARTQMVCDVPAAGASAVDIATVVDGRVTDREHIDANGEQHSATRDGCTGWESAKWSSRGRRVYVHSDLKCTGGVSRASSGILAISATGEWLSVQGVSTGSYKGVHVDRYRDVPNPPSIPAELSKALETRMFAARTARLAAGAAVGTPDVVEASHAVDAGVVEAWLTETQQRFGINARQLRTLSQEGVPPGVIDVLVALANPGVFAVNHSTYQGEALSPEDQRRAAREGNYAYAMPDYGYNAYAGYPYAGYGSIGCAGYGLSPFGGTPYGYAPYGYYSPYGAYGSAGCAGFSPYGYYGLGYGYGWYPGGGVVIVPRGPGGPAAPHGRATPGGYREGTGPAPGGTATPAPASGASGASAPRTAKPRSP